VIGRTQPASETKPQTLTQPFPNPGRRVEHAYRELDVALYGSDEDKKALGAPRLLARPWDPPTCVDPELRADVWVWLDRVVTWLNHEYVWDVAGMIPGCWPRHPHLVHEIAVLADVRRRAGQALTGDAMEEWHRYALPAFAERMRHRLRAHCEDKDHQPWPAKGRHTRNQTADAIAERARVFAGDLADHEKAPMTHAPSGPRLQLVDVVNIDLDAGEVLE
jgi:hypothetical protein